MNRPPPPRPFHPTLLLVRDPDHRHGFVARPTRLYERLMARVLAPSLDRHLASGTAPETSRLLATRAQVLVAPGQRRALARWWGHLLDVTGSHSTRPPRRLPLCRDRITASASAVREMLAALEAPAPVPVRGVAMASVLLRDGTGPLYNLLAPLDLPSALRQVTLHLDPAGALVATA